MKRSEQRTAEGILFTDQYQFTMAQLYHRVGLHEKQVQFDHFFRKYPDYGAHKAGYCINAGLEWLLDWMQGVHVRDEDVEYLQVEGQNHFITEHGKRTVWSSSIVAWFDRWLKDQPEWWNDLHPSRAVEEDE